MNDNEKRQEVPDWLLERLAHDDLPSAEAARVRAALAAEPQGAARLAALADSDREILRTLPPKVVAAAVKQRLAANPSPAHNARGWSVALSGLALGAAGLVAVFAGVIGPRGETNEGTAIEEITLKGDLKPQLIVYRKEGDSEDRLSTGTAVRPRDVVQLAYVAAGRRYGVILSFDARGTVTLHLPEVTGPAAALTPNGKIALPHAFELDDSPGFERFVLVLANHPFQIADVVGALAPGGPPLPKDFTSVELTLRKETP
jgi:hypothetical protein